MASLNHSEKRLLIIFAAGLFCVANFLVMGSFSERRQLAESAIGSFQEEIRDFEDEKRENPKWLATRAMLQIIEPVFVSEEAAATEIENHLKQCAIYSGATIDQIRPDPPIIDPASRYTKVPLGVKLSGSDDQVTRFVSLVTLAGWAQSAGKSVAKFYHIPEITYTSDKKDPTILRCTLVVTRWYANNASAGNSVIAAPEPEAVNPLTPAPAAPEPEAANPLTPAPAAPAPEAANPLTPAPAAPEPEAANPLTPAPAAPEPEAANPLTPTPTPAPAAPAPEAANALTPAPAVSNEPSVEDVSEE